MNRKIFTTLFSSLLLSVLVIGKVNAQSNVPWSGVFGNEWLEGKYNQKWLKINVSKKAIYNVALPTGFLDGASTDNLKLYHRGVEVALISVTTSMIEFYGVPNDGSSDALLYRPTTARINPYYSMFSDEGSYFLTIGTGNGKRAVIENITDQTGATMLNFHHQIDSKNYQTDYSHASYVSIRPDNLNSFMEDGQTRTGPTIIGSAANPINTNFPIQLNKKVGAIAPKVKILLHGRSNYAPNGSNPRNIHIYVGPTAATVKEVGMVSISGFKPGEFSFDIKDGDLTVGGAGFLGFKTDAPLQALFYDRFSVTYYNVDYDQETDMRGLASYEFTFPGTSQGTKNQIIIANPPSTGTLKFYDISDQHNPRIISGTASSLIFSRPNTSALTLLATNQPTIVDPSKVVSVQFNNIDKTAYDYLIISNEILQTSANAYAEYRKKDSPGRKYNSGVFKIKDIYNQFNYGEPSPIAIKRFVDYMISDGNRDKFLLLLGKSITRNDRMVKELPEEVPTAGFPGSDILLIDGLGGEKVDVPSIPVGRIPAINNNQVYNYLDKVKSYEATKTGLDWRRQVTHHSGGKTFPEVDLHASNLATVGSLVTSSAFNGKVVVFKKTTLADLPNPQQLDTLYKYVNAGVGMITYFGHSAPYQTDYNFGYVSDPAKKFNNPGKYPIMFYNGCDILNVFGNNFDSTYNLSTSRPQSLDWLLSPRRGAIAVFGNTFSGYASSCNSYMQKVYSLIFSTSDAERKTLGQILQEVSRQTKNAGNFRLGNENARVASVYVLDQAQIHQTILLADPALRILLSNEGGLPVELISFDAKMRGTSQVEVFWKTASEKDNSHFIIERSYNAKNFENIGTIEGKGDTNSESSYQFIDQKPLAGKSYYRLKQVDKIVENSNKEGISTYSKIVSVDRIGTNMLTVFPNPASSIVDIVLDAPVNVNSWSILDADGTVKASGKGVKANISDLVTGEYIIKILTENDDIYYRKIVKH